MQESSTGGSEGKFLEQFFDEWARILRDREYKDRDAHARPLSDVIRTLRERWREWVKGEIIHLKWIAGGLSLLSSGETREKLLASVRRLDTMDSQDLIDALVKMDSFIHAIENQTIVEPASVYAAFRSCLDTTGSLVIQLLLIRAWLDGLVEKLYHDRQQQPAKPPIGFRPRPN